MTRIEKFKIVMEKIRAAADPTKLAWEPSADPRAAVFVLRRAEQAVYPRYWARYGHELPKARKVLLKTSAIAT